MNSALRSNVSLPLRELRQRVWWSLDAEGTFTELDGPAAERARMALGGMFRGRSYREIFEAGTLARELIDRVYAGAPCAVGVIPWGGEWWEARAIGVYEDGQLVRVDGESVPVPEGTVLVGMPDEDVIAWEVRQTVRGAGSIYWPPSTIVTRDADGDYWECRPLPRYAAESTIRQHADRLLRHASASDALPAPSPASPPAAPSPRRHLRSV